MSLSRCFRGYIAERFNSKEQSDCSIVFYKTSDVDASPENEPDRKRRKLSDDQQDAQSSSNASTETWGEPIPAHLLVICGGSPRFRAQAERWAQGQDPNSKPVLRVPLEGADELPFALSTLRFMYTDSLDDLSSMEALLRVRRLAAYLQVEGCMEACDAAVTVRLTSSSSPLGPSGKQGPLAGVLDLFARRHLLPDTPEGDDAVAKLLNVCRQQLVQHSGSVSADGPLGLGAGGPSLGELLAWAFRDAPSALSDPETRKQMEALPLPAMEALLRCDSFASDNESSVLLLVAYWLVAFYKTTTDIAETRTRLCKLVRLSHLSSTYLHAVLPSFSWFPISPEEHRFLCDYAAAPAAQRARMAVAAAGLYDCGTAWYAGPVRPPIPAHTVRLYKWSIQEKDLEKAMATDAMATPSTSFVAAKFSNGAERVVSYGLEWCPVLHYVKGKDSVGAYLYCTWPQVLGPQNPEKIVALFQPGPVVFRIDKGGDEGGRGTEPVWQLESGPQVYVRVGYVWGEGAALRLQLPLQQAEKTGKEQETEERKATDQTSAVAAAGGPTTGPSSPLAPWLPYLKGGCLRGSLLWTW